VHEIEVKIIMIIRRWLPAKASGLEKAKECDICDPLANPELRRMSLRELSDLPFMRPSEISRVQAQNFVMRQD
jgi:hypothetical protein